MFFRPGQGATLLVVSSLGRRAPSRWVLGSVAGARPGTRAFQCSLCAMPRRSWRGPPTGVPWLPA
jgi:hypothetical protein